MQSNDRRCTQEEERGPGEQGAADNVRLDGRFSASVAKDSPNWRGDGIRSVFQAEKQTNVKRTQLKISKYLEKKGMGE